MMVEKLKVSHEVADAIERHLTRNTKNYNLSLESAMEDLIVRHPNVDWEDYLDGEFKELENIPTYDLMQALVLGYEVEMTPHEVIAEDYKEVLSKRNATFDSCKERFFDGYMLGIETTLENLKITVKGVNDND